MISKSGLSMFVLPGILFFSVVGMASEPSAAPAVDPGKLTAAKLCQACHAFEGADQAGTVGPPFIQMQERFPQRDRLRAIIFDAQKALKPHTMMPPFGKHGFVDKEQTEQLIDFLYKL